MTKLTLLGDWGSYLNWAQQVQFDFAEMREKAGLQGMIFRGDQEQISVTLGNYSTLKNIEAARRELPMAASYYWHYPDGNQNYYLDRYTRAIEAEKPDLIGVDMEQTMVWNPSSGTYVQVDPQRFSDTAQQLCEGLAARFPEKRIVPYTRLDIVTYYSPPTQLWISKFDGCGWEANWKDYGLIPYYETWEQIQKFLLMDYDTGAFVPVSSSPVSNIPGWTDNRILQYSSRILAPYPDGSTYAHTYDWNVYYGSTDEMLAWLRKETKPMTPQTYDPVFPQEARIPVIELTDDQAHADIALLAQGGTGAFALQMGGQDGVQGSPTMLYDCSAWPIRVPQVKATGLMLWGDFVLRGAYCGFNDQDEPIVKKILADTHSNKVFLKMLSELRTKPYTLESMTSTDGGWIGINALRLIMYDINDFKGNPLPGLWQMYALKLILDPLFNLQSQFKIPAFPVIVQANPSFFQLYGAGDDPFATYIWGLRKKIFLGMADPWFEKAPTALVLSPAEAWAFRVPDSYKYPFIPYGFGSSVDDNDCGHVVYHQAGYNRICFQSVTDSKLKNVATNTGFGCRDLPGYYDLLGYIPAEIPPDNPPDEPVDPTLKDLADRLKALEDWRASLAVYGANFPK